MKFNLAAWARAGGRRRSAVLPPIHPTVAGEAALRRVLTDLLAQAQRHATAYVLPAAISAKRSYHGDDQPEFEAESSRWRWLIDALVDAVGGLVSRILRVEAARHDAKLTRNVRSAIGIDLGEVIRSEDLDEALRVATQRNVALIRGLTSDVARRIETRLIEAMVEGRANRDIAQVLVEEFGIGRRRAAIIARDQAAKWNGEMTRLRQMQMGVTTYEWSSSLDERVRGNPDGKYPRARPSHWDREGKRFKWAEPPSDGHPGQPILCRCVARAVIEIED